ncbi:MAG TPA: thiamine pyrophosphate-binding protein [Streptosporangiaceae bacterium]|jgi:acetolactate synthase-1/2/3 large subunit
MTDAAGDSAVLPRTGADALAEALLGQAPELVVFLVTGNQNLPLVDALGRCGVTMVHARHESGAGYMAEGWARSAGTPGVCLVTAGPGLTSALTPLASARAAEVPLILLSASHPREQDGHGAFQELDQTTLTRPLCKAAFRAPYGACLGTLLTWAWQHATEFPPGPVHLELPADTLTELVPADEPLPPAPVPPGFYPVPARGAADGSGDGARAREIAAVLAAAQQPLVLLRPALGRSAQAARLRALMPVLAVESPRGLRDPAWADEQATIAAADVIVLLGAADYAVSFGRIGSADVHAWPDAGPASLGELADLLDGRNGTAPRSGRLTSGSAEDGATRLLANGGADLATGRMAGRPAHPLAVARIADRLVGDDDVLVIDGGEFCQWMRYGLRGRLGQQQVNGKLGAIGGGIPLGVGAALHAPGRRTVVFTGDGSFGYYGAEIDTAVRAGARLTVVVGVDGCWASEWHQQIAHYDGRTYATGLRERRYGLVAQGYGARGSDARDAGEFASLLAGALADPGVSCVSVRIERAASPAS